MVQTCQYSQFGCTAPSQIFRNPNIKLLCENISDNINIPQALIYGNYHQTCSKY